eukprot:TRINITY_DN4185_c0_g1_i1.p1 TRINITY_DN4185_c0_g1~~TRINITY_DN4185_c0_g1_i1.p1  ORF type:complete len:368 (-),score=70.22 TRINITY_DN4185_c0_g1_i1:79-1101(-)
MYALYFVETFALALLFRDALKGRAKCISTQMVVGLTLSIMSSMFNLPRHQYRITKISVIIAGSIVGTICSAAVSRTSEADGDDDFIIGRMQGRMSKLVPYVATLVMGLLSLLAACHFSIAEMILFMQKETKATACTFQNYLHAFALLPQLVLCRRQGFVSPAAVKFLFLIGVKHIFEFTSDAYVSWQHYQRGRLNLHEFSFMSGDFVAAVILLDFLYLIATSGHGFLLVAKETELELIEDAEAQKSVEGTTMQEPSKMASKSVQGRLADFLEAFDGDSANLRKLLICTVVFSAAMVGSVLGLISIYPMIFAGLGLIVWRFIANPELPLPMHEKKLKDIAA